MAKNKTVQGMLMRRAFTDSELAMVLHGLRMVQCEGRVEGCAAGDCEHFDKCEEMNNEQIDELCETLTSCFHAEVGE